MENEFLAGNVSVYPKDLEEAYLRLQSYKDPNRDRKVRAQRPNKTSSPNEDDPDGPRVSFAQVVNRTDGVLNENITCHGCGAEGHYKPNCPEESKTNKEGQEHQMM